MGRSIGSIFQSAQEIDNKKIVYTRAGTGTGRVTFTAGAQACDQSCERTFLMAGEVAHCRCRKSGFSLRRLVGGMRRHDPTCTVQVSNAISVTATFNTQSVSYPLTINKTGNGQVLCNGGVCQPNYTANEQVVADGHPRHRLDLHGWTFSGWTGCTPATSTT